MLRSTIIATVAMIAMCASCAQAGARPRVQLQTSGRVHVETFNNAKSKPVNPSYGWFEDGAKLSPFKEIELTFAIKLRSTDRLQKLFYQVSDPRSSHYRNYMSLSGVNALFAPTAKTVNIVKDWLRTEYHVEDSHITSTHGGEYIKARVPVVLAEKMLQTTFKTFTHPDGARIIRALDKYTLPRHIAQVVDFVGGVHRFPNRMTVNNPVEAQNIERQVIYTPRPAGVKPGALPTGNNPIPLATTGAGPTVATFLLPRCSNGQVDISGSNRLCTSSGSPTPGIGFMQGVQVSSLDNSTVNFNIPYSALTCAQCAKYAGSLFSLCNATISQYSLTQNTTFCLANIQGVQPFQGYRYQWASIFTSSFSSSKPSDLSALSNEVKNHPWIDVARLYQLYNVHDVKSGYNNVPDQAVAEFLGQYYDPTDLSTWFSLFNIDGQAVKGVVGPNNASLPGGEATLDIEFIMGMAPLSPTYFWSFAGAGQNPDNQEPFLEWMTYMNNETNPPYVHSISYADQEDQLTPEYMTRIDQEFQKAGLRGITLIFSAGDDGAGGVALRNASYQCTRFSPSFPPSSPSVTAVGGTQLSNNFTTSQLPIFQRFTQYGVRLSPDMQGERVSSTTTGSRITTGGGFSDVFATPPYQVEAVHNFLATNPAVPSNQWFNKSGRGYPDVASMATNYIVYLGGEVVPIGGTSASAPVIASLITLLNQAAINQGQHPLGFLNPMLYQAHTNFTNAFTDIVVGDNACSVYPTQCCPVGYQAGKGWDPTTGVGTPVFSSLFDIVNKISPPQRAQDKPTAGAKPVPTGAAWRRVGKNGARK